MKNSKGPVLWISILGRNPRSGQVLHDPQPMAGMGAITARVFLDRNLNGRFDEGDEAIQDAGFTVNGSGRLRLRTDERGEALLARLQPMAFADIALDVSTLEDAQWQPTTLGVRVLPRPGIVQSVEFPVVFTSEIDGSVYLLQDGHLRGIGNARVQLVDLEGKFVDETKTSSDGYYVLPHIRPGRYQLRLAPEQLTGLGLKADRVADIEVTAEGNFVFGVDFTLSQTESS